MNNDDRPAATIGHGSTLGATDIGAVMEAAAAEAARLRTRERALARDMEVERLINNDPLRDAVLHFCAAGLGNPTGHNPEAEVRRIVRQEIERALEDRG